MRVLVENAGAQRGFLVLPHDGRLMVEAAITVEPDRVRLRLATDLDSSNELASTIVQYVARTKEPVVLSDATTDRRFSADPYLAVAKPKSLLCMAMSFQGRFVGVLYLENNAAANVFNPARLALLQVLAAQAAVAIENAKLYSELQAATDQLRGANETLEHQVAQRTEELRQTLANLWGEMDLARKIQTVLLPTRAEVAGYEVAMRTRPADTVGGDYYDIFRADTTDWVLIGDVSGHGVSAGLIMMMAQSAVRATTTTLQQLGSPPSPRRVLSLVNRAIFANLQQIGQGQYMTLTALNFDGGTVHYSGLHQDILIYRAATGTIEAIETHGIWIGVLAEIDHLLRDASISLMPGDVLLLYTDGLVEAKVGGRYVGTEGLTRLFAEAVTQERTMQGAVERLVRHVGIEAPHDDVTVVMLRRNSPTERG